MPRLLLLFILPIFTPAFGQYDSLKFKMVTELLKSIQTTYVSPELAVKMCDSVNLKFQAGGYDPEQNLDEFAFELTKDLRRISRDRHIAVTKPRYRVARYSGSNGITGKSFSEKHWKKYLKKERAKWAKRNREDSLLRSIDFYKYGDIKILPGNVGYLEIKSFEHALHRFGDKTKRIALSDAMKFLKSTESLIIDLRDNPGGSSMQAVKFCSYFAPKTRMYFETDLAEIRYDSADQFLTHHFVNKTYTDEKIANFYSQSKKILILTSERTFSAAESVAYKLKLLHKNTMSVGANTPGGGNSHFGPHTSEYYTAIIPCGRSVDENNFNYSVETNGVKPDLPANPDSAFDIAYRLLLPSNVSGKVKYFQKQKTESHIPSEYFQKFLSEYVGKYQKAIVSLQGRNLKLTYDELHKSDLLYLAIDYFSTGENKTVRFLRNAAGKVYMIEIKHSKEFTERFRLE